jgi:hypothetical protein
MEEQNQSLEDLQHIKKMMEQSGRFISLSGLSGIAAGICALIGAWFAKREIYCWVTQTYTLKELFYVNRDGHFVHREGDLLVRLFVIAACTFAAAFVSAFLFTYLRSKKDNNSMWSSATIRLFWNTVIPLGVGALFLLKMMDFGDYGLVAPGCLIFYGLALVNASKYTLGEIRYLGYGQLILGIINLNMIGYGLYFWAIGFGVLHIIYGAAMWWKYERNAA